MASYKSVPLQANPGQLSQRATTLQFQIDKEREDRRIAEEERKRKAAQSGNLLNNIVSGAAAFLGSGGNPLAGVAGALMPGDNPLSSAAQGFGTGGMVKNVLGSNLFGGATGQAAGAVTPAVTGAQTLTGGAGAVVPLAAEMPKQNTGGNVLSDLWNKFTTLTDDPGKTKKVSILLNSLANPKTAIQGLSDMADLDAKKAALIASDQSKKVSAHQLWRLFRNEAGGMTKETQQADKILTESLNSDKISGDDYVKMVNSYLPLSFTRATGGKMIVTATDKEVENIIQKMNLANTIPELDAAYLTPIAGEVSIAANEKKSKLYLENKKRIQNPPKKAGGGPKQPKTPKGMSEGEKVYYKKKTFVDNAKIALDNESDPKRVATMVAGLKVEKENIDADKTLTPNQQYNLKKAINDIIALYQ
jgi:hypothetical protein